MTENENNSKQKCNSLHAVFYYYTIQVEFIILYQLLFCTMENVHDVINNCTWHEWIQ